MTWSSYTWSTSLIFRAYWSPRRHRAKSVNTVLLVLLVAFMEHAPLTQGVKVLIAGQVVPNEIVGLPATKQGKAGTDLHLHRVIQNLEV